MSPPVTVAGTQSSFSEMKLIKPETHHDTSPPHWSHVMRTDQAVTGQISLDEVTGDFASTRTRRASLYRGVCAKNTDLDLHLQIGFASRKTKRAKLSDVQNYSQKTVPYLL